MKRRIQNILLVKALLFAVIKYLCNVYSFMRGKHVCNIAMVRNSAFRYHRAVTIEVMRVLCPYSFPPSDNVL